MQLNSKALWCFDFTLRLFGCSHEHVEIVREIQKCNLPRSTCSQKVSTWREHIWLQPYIISNCRIDFVVSCFVAFLWREIFEFLNKNPPNLKFSKHNSLLGPNLKVSKLNNSMKDLNEPPCFWKPLSSEDRASRVPCQRLNADVQELRMRHIIRVPVDVSLLDQRASFLLFLFNQTLFGWKYKRY